MEGYEFDAMCYLHSRYGDVTVEDRVQFQLKALHRLFRSFPHESCLKIVDFGCGPVIQHSISAASRAAEIVFADIAESNRLAIKKWLRNDPDAFDWSPHFDYVVQILEGKEKEEAREREKKLRHIAKAVWCDYFASGSIIEKGFEGPYDVVLESNSLQAACTDLESFKLSLKLLSGLLKPGGTLALYGEDISMETTTQPYYINSKEYPSLCITHQYIASFLNEGGFIDTHTDYLPIDPLTQTPYNNKKGKNGFYFITARTSASD